MAGKTFPAFPAHAQTQFYVSSKRPMANFTNELKPKPPLNSKRRVASSQIAMIQRSASVHPAHGNERESAGAPPAFRPRVRYKLDRPKPRRLPSRVTLAHRRRNWHTSALKAGRLPARVPPALRQRPLTMGKRQRPLTRITWLERFIGYHHHCVACWRLLGEWINILFNLTTVILPQLSPKVV